MAAAVLPPTARTDRSVAVVRADATGTDVVMRGEWDVSARPVLADVLSRVIALPAGDVVVDLAQAEFIDSATVRVLVCKAISRRAWRSSRLDRRREATMYIGGGTILLILIIVIVLMMMRGRSRL